MKKSFTTLFATLLSWASSTLYCHEVLDDNSHTHQVSHQKIDDNVSIHQAPPQATKPNRSCWDLFYNPFCDSLERLIFPHLGSQGIYPAEIQEYSKDSFPRQEDLLACIESIYPNLGPVTSGWKDERLTFKNHPLTFTLYPLYWDSNVKKLYKWISDCKIYWEPNLIN